jgi:hypothetical protein
MSEIEINIENPTYIGEQFRMDCSTCKTETKHTIVSATTKQGKQSEIMYGHPEEHAYVQYWTEEYQVVQCNGCENLVFRLTHENSEDMGLDGPVVYTDIYPNPEQGRLVIKDSHLLPNKLERIYSETLKSLNSNQPVLTGIGIRAIVETVCKDQSANGRNLFDKINDLKSNKILTESGAVILHKLRTLGNDSAHEVQPHTNVQLGLALDVIDNLLQSVYILPHHASSKLS